MVDPTSRAPLHFLIRAGTFCLLTYILILGLFLASQPFVPATDISKARFSTLDSLRPENWTYLLSVVNEKKPYDQRLLKDFLRYFNAVDQEIPDQPEILGLLGFIHFHLHKDDQAIAFYKKAIEKEPDCFWFYHNLALIYFKNGRKNEALTVGIQAIKLDPKATFQYMQRPSAIHPPLQTYAMPSSYNNNTAAFVRGGYADMLFLIRSILDDQGKESNFESAGFKDNELPRAEPSLAVY